ncbi:MAG: hypothetical protein K9G34_12130 [Melioribacteraceae bacterium]|nr:hypothetical protein [Melioribacteraceae bacterium]
MKNKLLLLILAFTPCLSYAQIDNDILAEVGEFSITKSEFLERYELTPQFNRHASALEESNKLKFLYTLIAEKLWANSGKENFLDSSLALKTVSSSMEKMYVRDALYKEEVTNKIYITQNEITEGLARLEKNLNIRFLFSTDESEINRLHGLLESGIPFDTLLSERVELKEQLSPIQIEYGQMEAEVEDSIFQLKVNEYTSPILTPDGWYIFYLVNKSTNPLGMELSQANSIKYVEKILGRRKAKYHYYDFYQSFFKNKEINADSKLFLELAEVIYDRLLQKRSERENYTDELIHIEADDVISIEEKIGGKKLQEIFIKFKNNPISLGQFFREIVFDGIKTNKFDRKEFFGYLNQLVRKFIEFDLLAREGYRRGLHELPEVKNAVAMWNSYYLFQSEKENVTDTVTVADSTLLNYYQKKYLTNEHKIKIKILSVTFDSLITAETILNKIDESKSLKEAANLTRISYTLSGLKPYMEFPYVGSIALQMSEGDIYGPIKIQNKFTIFELIEKKIDSSDISPPPFKDVKESLRAEIARKIINSKVDDLTVELAKKYDIKINTSLLKSLEVTNINVFAMRVMGFGGKTLAVPMSAPFNNWVEKWLKVQKDIL